MPYISELDIHSIDGQPTAGFRSLLGRYALPPCLLLAGCNGSGKTAHLNAIEAAVQGLTKSRAVGGKTSASDASKPRRAYPGDDLFPGAEIRLTLSTGQSFTRPLDTANENAKAVKTADADAARLVGQPAVPWSPIDFLRSSDLAREQLFAAAAQAGGVIEAWDTQSAMDETRTLLMESCPADIDAETWTAPLDALCKAYTEAEGGGGHWLVLVSPVAEERRLKTGRAKDAAHAAHKQHEATMPTRPTTDRTGAKARHSAALVRQDAAVRVEERAARYAEQKAAHDAEVTRIESALEGIVTRGKALRAELETAKATPAPVAEPLPADVLAELEAARADVGAPVPPPDGSRIPELETAVQEANVKLDVVFAIADDLAGKLVPLEAAEDRARASTDEAQKAVDAAGDTIITANARVQALESMTSEGGVCVHCGEPDPHGHAALLVDARTVLEAAKAAAVPLVATLDAARASLTLASSALTDGRKAAKDAAAECKTPGDAVTATEAALASARSDLTGHDTRIRAERTARLARAQGAADRARVQSNAAYDRAVKAHGQRITDAGKAVTDLLESHKRTAAALASAKANPPVEPSESVDVTDVPGIVAECAAIEAEWIAYELAQTKAEKGAAEALAASIAHAAAEAAVKALRGAREHLASSAYAPVEKHMRSIMARCGDELPVPYFRGPTEIGAARPGAADVDLAALSASEQLITLTCLTCAMSKIAGLPLTIAMLDEIGKVQADHRVPLLRGLCEAQAAGEIDQVLFTLPTSKNEAEAEAELAPYREIPGLEVRRLDRREPAPVVARIAPAAMHATDGSAALKLDDELPF